MFVCDIFHRVADLMNNAQLHGGFRKNAFDGIGEAFKPVYTRDQDVVDSPALQVGKYREPEVGSFALGYVHAKQILVTILVQSKHVIYGSTDGTLLVVHHLVMKGIQPYDRIDSIQRAVLPALYFGQNAVGNGADSFR